MTDTREARHELGWLVGDDDVEAVHLAEMLELRRQWPVPHEKATTSREQMVSDALDVGIQSALLAIGLRSFRDDFGSISITIVRARDTQEEMFRATFAMVATSCCEAVKEIVAGDNRDRDHQNRVLADALGGAGAHLYADTFGPPAIDDEDSEQWWETLGYASFDDWLAQPPWWQQKGFASLAEADADWAAGEQEMEDGMREQQRRVLHRLDTALRHELKRRGGQL